MRPPAFGPAGRQSGPQVVPAGYRLFRDDKLGFSAAIPTGWVAPWAGQEKERQFQDSGGRNIFVRAASGDPLANATGERDGIQRDTVTYTGFRPLRLQSIDYADAAAELEYTITIRRGGGEYHASIRWFSIGGRGFYADMSARSDDFERAKADFVVFLRTFRAI